MKTHFQYKELYPEKFTTWFSGMMHVKSAAWLPGPFSLRPQTFTTPCAASLSSHWKQKVLSMPQTDFTSFSLLLRLRTSQVPRHQLQTLAILPCRSCTGMRRCSFEEREAAGSVEWSEPSLLGSSGQRDVRWYRGGYWNGTPYGCHVIAEDKPFLCQSLSLFKQQFHVPILKDI